MYTSLLWAPASPLGSNPKHNSERERVTCTPECQASSGVKERIHTVQELQHCWRLEMSIDPGNTGPTFSCSSKRSGSELQTMSLVAQIASNATGVLFESRCYLFSGLFLAVWDGVVQLCCSLVLCSFYFPDDCQAIKDDDFVLFFGLPFHAPILCYSR